MELPLSLQAAQFFQAALMGLLLAAAYDFLRALRRLRPRLGTALDVLFAALVFCALTSFTLVQAKGLFRLFFFPAAFLGAALWFLTASPAALRVFSALWRGLGRVFGLLLRPFGFILKKTWKILKKFFASREKWVTIFDKIFRTRKRSETRHEVCKIVSACEAGRSDSGRLRGRDPGVAPLADRRQKQPGRNADRKHRGRRAGKRPAAGIH